MRKPVLPIEDHLSVELVDPLAREVPARRLCRGTVSGLRGPLHLPETYQSAQSAHEPAQEALCGHVLLGQGRAFLGAFCLRRPLESLLDLVHPPPCCPLRDGLEAVGVHLPPVPVFVVETHLPPAVAALPNALVRALHVPPLFPSDRKPGRDPARKVKPLADETILCGIGKRLHHRRY